MAAHKKGNHHALHGIASTIGDYFGVNLVGGETMKYRKAPPNQGRR